MSKSEKNGVVLKVGLILLLPVIGWVGSGLLIVDRIKGKVESHDKQLVEVKAAISEIKDSQTRTQNDIGWIKDILKRMEERDRRR